MSTRGLRIVLELPGPAAVAAAVGSGLGIGLVPQSIARLFVGQVAAVRIEGFSLVQHVYIIRDRKALNSPAVSAWWKFVEGKVGAIRESPAELAAEPAASQPDVPSARTVPGSPKPRQRPAPDPLLGQIPTDSPTERVVGSQA
jgi:hypothetical protein